MALVRVRFLNEIVELKSDMERDLYDDPRGLRVATIYKNKRGV